MLGSLIAMLAPAGVDIFKKIVDSATEKWIGLSVDDKIKLSKSETDRLAAVAALDNPGGTPSQWVVDLRASFRYIAAGLSILGGLASIYMGLNISNAAIVAVGADLVGIPFAFIFGERMYLKFTTTARK